MKRLILTFWVIGLVAAQPGTAKTITLAVDNRDWFPFFFQERESPTGMHVDIVTHALRELGYQLQLLSYPRKRAIRYTQAGVVDGMISLPFHSEWTHTMHFPKDAAPGGESAWRIMQVDHVLITPRAASNYEGDLESLPEPVRLPMGEAMARDLEKAGIQVDEARSDLINIRKMVRDQSGSVITTSILAEQANEAPAFAGKLKIHATPIASDSYFLAFSRKSPLSFEEKQQIWDEIQKWRNDYVFMLQVYAKY